MSTESAAGKPFRCDALMQQSKMAALLRGGGRTQLQMVLQTADSCGPDVTSSGSGANSLPAEISRPAQSVASLPCSISSLQLVDLHPLTQFCNRLTDLGPASLQLLSVPLHAFNSTLPAD